MARWNKKKHEQQLRWSNDCYRNAVLTHFGHLLNDKEKELSIPRIKQLLMKKLEVERFDFPELNTIYLNNLCQLETDKLELIVEAYNKGKQYRSASTIDVILSELFERVTNPRWRKYDLK
jgi:hypothetical protein